MTEPEASPTPRTSVAEVFAHIIQHDPLFILDVRNEEDYRDWRIEGPSVQSVNVPYFDLLDDLGPLEGKLPSDTSVLVVCAKEGSSDYVALQLREQGRHDVSVLEGGMKQWSQHLHVVKVGDLSGGGALYQCVRVGKGCLSYIIAGGGEAVVVDAARMTQVYESFAKELGVQIRHLMDTHLHADHISGGRRLAAGIGADYWLPPGDAENVNYSYSPLGDGITVTIADGTISIRAVASPGHTSGSTSLVVDNTYLLSGDTLFVKSIGRPDLAGKAGDWAYDLYTTLYRTYQNLNPDLTVLPAHYANSDELDGAGRVLSKLGTLFQENRALSVTDASEFHRLVTEHLPQQPNAYQQIREVNMGRFSVLEDAQLEEMEIGPNRCAVSG
ncbi:MBL fold metallo-hydrolase [Alicyclobacillus sp. ALC3]|uniref:MBL fold metallo-hydrolase n=1 Tax=Alicyclobacillus sp. ALC3 TaxID=2796143 RepID=UPI003FCE7003